MVTWRLPSSTRKHVRTVAVAVFALLAVIAVVVAIASLAACFVIVAIVVSRRVIITSCVVVEEERKKMISLTQTSEYICKKMILRILIKQHCVIFFIAGCTF